MTSSHSARHMAFVGTGWEGFRALERGGTSHQAQQVPALLEGGGIPWACGVRGRNCHRLRQDCSIGKVAGTFIPGFTTICHPLTRLTGKGVKFAWDQECQSPFEQLKHLLKTAPVLAYPDPLTPMCLDTDASGRVLVAKLSQGGEDCCERVCQLDTDLSRG